MQPTRTVVEPTPADHLRQAAQYLRRYGWTQGGFYDPDSTHPFPPACMTGAIQVAVFGTTTPDDTDGDIVTDSVVDPASLDAYIAARKALAAYLDPDADLFETSSIDVIGDWNDADERTLSAVLDALEDAATTWDTTHPSGGEW